MGVPYHCDVGRRVYRVEEIGQWDELASSRACAGSRFRVDITVCLLDNGGSIGMLESQRGEEMKTWPIVYTFPRLLSLCRMCRVCTTWIMNEIHHEMIGCAHVCMSSLNY